MDWLIFTVAALVVGWSVKIVQGQGLPSPPTILNTSPQSTSITLTWSQPSGDVVDSYQISYSYTIRVCGNLVMNAANISVANSSRMYSLTGLEENSDYTIFLTAINVNGSSPTVNTAIRTTLAAPSAPPVDLMISFTSPTNVSLSWEEVPCAGRNVDRITGYQIVTRTTSDNMIRNRERDHRTRIFTDNRLIPRTNYTFEVNARYDDIDLNNPLFGPAAVITGVTAIPQAVGFFLRGVLYPNNSVVSLTDIGEGYNALHCLTNLTTCCRGADGGSAGEWFLPGQTSPVVDVNAPNAGTESFTRSRGPSAVLLNRRTSAVGPTGLFTCQVPDGSDTNRTLHIGIRRMSSNTPAITDLDYDRDSRTLTCISSGGPVDSVTWTKDGSLITEDSSTFSLSQIITDATAFTYHHVLSSSNPSNFVGSFTCVIEDAAHNINSRTRNFNGVEISNDPFVVGSRAVVNCSSDSGVVDRIQWMSGNVVLVSGTSIQQLMHVVDPVRDNLHGSEFVCIVTRSRGTVVVNQTLPISVRVPDNSISVTISRSGRPVAGSVFDLTCTVSEVISGLTNMPTAAWLDSNNMEITQDTTVSRSDNVSSAILRFNPLRTSLQQRYRCSGSIVSPALPNPVGVTTDSTFIIEISTPIVSTTVLSGPLFIGGVDNTILTCSATLGAGVDNPAVIRYNYTWLDREGREIVSGGRTIITPTTPSTSSSSTLTLSPLSTTDTNFTCRVTLSDSRNLLRPSDPGEQRTDVNVLIPSAPVVRIESAGESTAGVNHTITCTVTLEQDLRSPLLVQWTAPNGNIIRNETFTRSSNNLSLTFDPLHTSHGGQYSCMASVNILSEADTFLSGQASLNITIHHPHLVITRSIYTGECITNEAATLIGNVTLTPSISGNPTFSYTWQVPSGRNITVSTGDYTVNQGSIRVGNNTGRYTLHVCVNIPETGIVNLCNSTTFTLSFDVPGKVTRLMCMIPPRSNGRTLILGWEPPSLNPHSVIDYVVEVEQYQQLRDSREVQLVSLDPPLIKVVDNPTFVMIHSLSFEMSIPYRVLISPRNAVGCGTNTTMNCFTMAGVPVVAPRNVTARRSEHLNNITVSWEPLTLVEAKGFIRYTITLTPNRGGANLTMVVPGHQNNATFNFVDPAQNYEVRVAALTSSGHSGPGSAMIMSTVPQATTTASAATTRITNPAQSTVLSTSNATTTRTTNSTQSTRTTIPAQSAILNATVQTANQVQSIGTSLSRTIVPNIRSKGHKVCIGYFTMIGWYFFSTQLFIYQPVQH